MSLSPPQFVQTFLGFWWRNVNFCTFTRSVYCGCHGNPLLKRRSRNIHETNSDGNDSDAAVWGPLVSCCCSTWQEHGQFWLLELFETPCKPVSVNSQYIYVYWCININKQNTLWFFCFLCCVHGFDFIWKYISWCISL